MKIKILILLVAIFLLSSGFSYSKIASQKFVYSKNEPNVFSTYNWSVYHPENKIIRYSFEYPKNWSVNDSGVFDDQNGQKIGEILPGVVILKQNQKLLEVIAGESSDYQVDEAGPKPELISKQNIRFRRYKSTRVVESVIATDGQGSFIEWYPVTYYLQDKDRVFGIVFYERELDSGLRKVFDNIVKSFRFID